MSIRLYVPAALAAGSALDLPSGPARHAQVRRVQPGDTLLLFDGGGSDWPAQVLAVGRSSVTVRVGQPLPVANELPLAVTLAVGMPANERMDTLVEKATELGVATIQPLLTERSVLRLAGERADKKRAHWQAIAEAACEQCGRARVPVVAPVLRLADWLVQAPAGARWVLSLQPDAHSPGALPPAHGGRDSHHLEPGEGSVIALNGPEGGLAADEEAAARQHGFVPVTLGRRVLRADTAPLALLAWLAVAAAAPPG